jgi:uncharacterized protein YdeI (YjbR/CyaY-like superfamily)
MKEEALETFYPASRKEWRQWLKKNNSKRQSIWLICYKLKSNVPTISWSEAVDEALCFGWIDSIRKPLDHEKFIQFFSKRKARSTWSKVNKEKITRLIDSEQMTPAGFESIEAAKQNGSWIILDDVEELIIPKDLAKEFKTNPGSKDFFLSLSKSAKKAILQWLVLAKLSATRQRRIVEIAELASRKMKPKQFR